MKTPPRDLTERLLEVSAEVLKLDAEPRLEDIARMVGASRATLYYYFSGRDDLLDFLLVAHVEEGAAQIQAATDPMASPQARLHAVVSAMLRYLGARPGMCAGLLGALGAAGRMTAALQANDAHIARPLRELLIEGRAEGAFTFDHAGDAASAILGAALLGVLGRALAGEEATDPRFVTGLADQIVRGVVVS
jgi:AcrR family transcriptional regulator